MHKIDNFLIDEVFQPVSDRLADWISCYGLAAFMLTGFALEDLWFNIYKETFLWIAVGALWIIPLTLRAYRLDTQAARNVIPVERIQFFLSRMGNLIVIPCLMLGGVISAHGASKLNSIAWFLVLLAEYFMACIKRPPSRKKAKLPSGNRACVLSS